MSNPASPNGAPPPGTIIESVDHPRQRWRVVTLYRDANGRAHVVLSGATGGDWRTLALGVVNDPSRFATVANATGTHS